MEQSDETQNSKTNCPSNFQNDRDRLSIDYLARARGALLCLSTGASPSPPRAQESAQQKARPATPRLWPVRAHGCTGHSSSTRSSSSSKCCSHAHATERRTQSKKIYLKKSIRSARVHAPSRAARRGSHAAAAQPRSNYALAHCHRAAMQQQLNHGLMMLIAHRDGGASSTPGEEPAHTHQLHATLLSLLDN